MHVLVVGGSGHVGGLVLPHIAARHAVRVYDRMPPADASWDYASGDVTDLQGLSEAAQGMEAVIYMAMGKAGSEGIHNAAAAFDVNVKGVHLALQAAHSAGVQQAVYTSSMSVYKGLGHRFFDSEDVPPDAQDLYGFTKRLGELVAQNAAGRWNMNVNVLRLYGPTPDDRWKQRARDHQPIFDTAASDVARALLAALDLRRGYQVFMISGDYTRQAMNMTRAKEVLGWEPIERP